MAKRMIADLRIGEPLEDTFLLSACELRTARNGSLYLDLTLADRSGSIKARMWDASEALHRALAVDDFVRIKARLGMYRNERQLIVNVIAKADPAQIDLRDFLPQSARPPEEMRKELEDLLRKAIEDPDYRRLAEAFLTDDAFMESFCTAPAAISYHHSFLAGLLEHTLSMAHCALLLCSHYRILRRDLLLAGVFVHDIGKTRELSWERTFQYTDAGQLVGHIIEGVVMIEERAASLDDFPPRKLNLLRHAIIAHHGAAEFGSPKLPMIPEAFALHYIDNLDAKLQDFADALADDNNSNSDWTAYIPRLGRRLYKK